MRGKLADRLAYFACCQEIYFWIFDFLLQSASFLSNLFHHKVTCVMSSDWDLYRDLINFILPCSNLRGWMGVKCPIILTVLSFGEVWSILKTAAFGNVSLALIHQALYYSSFITQIIKVKRFFFKSYGIRHFGFRYQYCFRYLALKDFMDIYM